MKSVAITDVTPGSAGSYVDVDVTTHVGTDAGNLAGVALMLVNTHATTAHSAAFRKNGSTDTLAGNVRALGSARYFVGVDSSDIFEANIANITDLKVYLIGYWLTSEGGSPTNVVDKSLGSTGAWVDIDISADTGAGVTAVAAFFAVDNTSATARAYGFRKNGSTDARTGNIIISGMTGAVVGCDGSEICEGNIGNVALDFFLTGWLTANVSTQTNGTDKSTATTGSYVDVDCSAEIPSGNAGAIYEVIDASADSSFAARKNGDTDDHYQTIHRHQYGWVPVDSSRIFEQKISATSRDLYLHGYTNTPVFDFTPFLGRPAGQHGQSQMHQLLAT